MSVARKQVPNREKLRYARATARPAASCDRAEPPSVRGSAARTVVGGRPDRDGPELLCLGRERARSARVGRRARECVALSTALSAIEASSPRHEPKLSPGGLFVG